MRPGLEDERDPEPWDDDPDSIDAHYIRESSEPEIDDEGRETTQATRRHSAEDRRIMANQQPLGPLGPDVAVTHILVVTDPARSRDFWVGVLGAELYREYGGTSVVLRFAGTWLLLVSGGGPTADKPTVVFQPPADADLVSHAMTLRVADCQAAYEALRSRGAAFLTPPHDWGSEIRCFLRDPDGHLVEISQSKPADSGN
jgi:catechol 2,3-dioxygenase-like lactoylglutathione lyase family enzyme